MKICYIIPRLVGPYGGERHVLCWASELAKLGHDISIYTHKFSADCSSLVSSTNVKIIETGFPKLKSHDISVILDFILMPNLVSKLNGNYDIVHVWGFQGAFGGFLMKKFCKRYDNVPVLYTSGEPPRFAYDLKQETLSNKSFFIKHLLNILIPLIKLIDKLSVKAMDKVIANGEWGYMQFKQIYGINPEIVYPGVEIERFERYSKFDARKMLQLDETSKIFLSVSKLHIRKRINEALKVYEQYSNNFQNSIFFIIGDGPEKNNLEELAVSSGLNNVHFLGKRSDEEVTLYYKAADYFIFTAKNEPFGIAPLEAKVSGCELIPEDRLNPIIFWEDSARSIVRIYEESIKNEVRK